MQNKKFWNHFNFGWTRSNITDSCREIQWRYRGGENFIEKIYFMYNIFFNGNRDKGGRCAFISELVYEKIQIGVWTYSYPSSHSQNKGRSVFLLDCIKALCYTFFMWSCIKISIWILYLRENDLLGDRGVNERKILSWNFRKWDVGAWTGLIWLRTGTGGGHFNTQ
jgi:hypothetical protein